ncbi:MAG: hypothetical protein E4H13_04670 [Calditrichales bacterium]|nr:MAG: hypothetical protein E4H13_04670 [Calditrichales bacterium]
MPQNVLIAGAPGIGKTTLISRLYRDLTPLLVRGFYKEALHENQVIKGYHLRTFNFQELVYAHIHLEGPDRFGEFGLNKDGLDHLVTRELSTKSGTELFLIDEIGLMECQSVRFCRHIIEAMNSDIPLIATLASIDVLDVLDVKDRKDITLLKMNQKNKNSLWKTVLVEISKPSPE